MAGPAVKFALIIILVLILPGCYYHKHPICGPGNYRDVPALDDGLYLFDDQEVRVERTDQGRYLINGEQPFSVCRINQTLVGEINIEDEGYMPFLVEHTGNWNFKYTPLCYSVEKLKAAGIPYTELEMGVLGNIGAAVDNHGLTPEQLFQASEVCQDWEIIKRLDAPDPKNLKKAVQGASQ
jgi:hypothetical protein